MTNIFKTIEMAKTFKYTKAQFAFTLAEVLIAIAIVGTVAAMTIPTLIVYNQEKGWNTSANVFERKLGEAMSIMNTQQVLGGLGTTENFLKELSKHLKIIKTCTNPTECFESKITTDNENEIIDITKIIKSKNLYSTANPDWDTKVIGVQFANGISGLIAYNPSCKSDPFSNEIINIKGKVINNGKDGTVKLETDCLSLLYDVNGYGGPNHYTEDDKKKDIRGINISFGIE